MSLRKKILLTLAGLLLLLPATGAAVGWMLSAPLSDGSLNRLARSPNYRDARFVNIEPEAGFELSWKTLTDAFSASDRSAPKDELPVDHIDPSRLSTPPGPGLSLAWLGHSTVLIEIAGKRILTDPVLSPRASPFTFFGPSRLHPAPIELDGLTGVDAVLISHNHYDHLDEATIRHLGAQGTRFFVPLGNRDLLLSWGIPEAQVSDMDWWDEARLGDVRGDVRIVATPSRHYSNRGLFDYQATLWGSWSVLGPEHRVFVSGDTGYSRVFSDIGEQFGPFDATVIKVGAYGPGANWHDIHMTPEEAVQVHRDVRGGAMLPVHWATFNLAYHAWDEPIIRTVAAARASNVTILTPRPGQFTVAEPGDHLTAWWRALE